MITRRTACILAGAVALISSVASAGTLPVPSDKPILNVSGKIATTNKDGAAVFDRAMLETLGMVSFETTTPWFTGKVKFEGVPMAKLMKALGASGDTLAVTALNDYTSELPIGDFDKYNVILALKRDGEYMPVSNKGPLFIVYPYDSDPELKSQKYYSRSAWQVARIVVK
jgi:hypothetical protein